MEECCQRQSTGLGRFMNIQPVISVCLLVSSEHHLYDFLSPSPEPVQEAGAIIISFHKGVAEVSDGITA